MKRLPWMGSALAALLVCVVPALARADGCCCGSSCCEAAPCETVALRAEITLRPYKEQVPVAPAAVVRRVEGVRTVPCTRSVPVCVTDPCTGCTHTEYKQETVMEQVKTVNLEILPPAGPCTTRTEERVKACVTIHIDHLPAAPCASH